MGSFRVRVFRVVRGQDPFLGPDRTGCKLLDPPVGQSLGGGGSFRPVHPIKIHNSYLCMSILAQSAKNPHPTNRSFFITRNPHKHGSKPAPGTLLSSMFCEEAPEKTDAGLGGAGSPTHTKKLSKNPRNPSGGQVALQPEGFSAVTPSQTLSIRHLNRHKNRHKGVTKASQTASNPSHSSRHLVGP